MVFCLCILGAHAQTTESQALPPDRSQIFNLKIMPLDKGARLIATLTARPDYRLMLLDEPTRLVMDLNEADLSPALDADTNKAKQPDLVRNLTYGFDGLSGTRIIIETRQPFKIDDILVDQLHESIWQLIIDLKPTTAQDFAEKIALMSKNLEPRTITRNTVDQQTNTEKDDPKSRPFTLVLDAGHGGFDVGAEGISGIWEKDVTLAFAQELRDILAREYPDFVVHLTRERDVFLRLNERIRKAHDWHADLFISIHADSIHLPNVRGATVYTISDKASDALAKAIADNENKADLLDGLPPDEPREVVDILLDLTRSETDRMSIAFADTLVDHLNRSGVRLIRPSHRYAGFMVLRAPEIPSVLIELGYLSNKEDEKLISDANWRAGVASIMAQAIKEYVTGKNKN